MDTKPKDLQERKNGGSTVSNDSNQNGKKVDVPLKEKLNEKV